MLTWKVHTMAGQTGLRRDLWARLKGTFPPSNTPHYPVKARTRGDPMEKSSLTALARTQLTLAKQAPSGRSAHTVFGGHEHVLRQTLIALTAGTSLAEHENPGEATVQVLHGRIRLVNAETSWDGSPGDLLIVPDARHSLEAVEASVILLTVAKH